MQSFGYKYVATGYWTQSGGIIKDVWRPVFKKFKPQKNKSWLILGLATGTVARLIPQPARIIGVEIDPSMIYLGKRYFDLDKIPNLEIIITDARKFKSQYKYDYVLVDMYLGDQLPKFVYSRNYLDQLGKLGQLVIINHLFYTSEQKQNAKKIIKILEKKFSKVELIRSLTNLLIICS